MWFSINNTAIEALVVLLLLISLVSVAQDNQGNMGATFTPPKKKPKKSNRVVTIDTRPQTLELQVDSPVYWVKTKVDKEYYCNIIAMAEGNYMNRSSKCVVDQLGSFNESCGPSDTCLHPHLSVNLLTKR